MLTLVKTSSKTGIAEFTVAGDSPTGVLGVDLPIHRCARVRRVRVRVRLVVSVHTSQVARVGGPGMMAKGRTCTICMDGECIG